MFRWMWEWSMAQCSVFSFAPLCHHVQWLSDYCFFFSLSPLPKNVWCLNSVLIIKWPGERKLDFLLLLLFLCLCLCRCAWELICFVLIVMDDSFMSYKRPLIWVRNCPFSIVLRQIYTIAFVLYRLNLFTLADPSRQCGRWSANSNLNFSIYLAHFSSVHVFVVLGSQK